MKTNRDLYLAIIELLQEKRSSPRTLEEYLRAVLGRLEPFRSESTLRLADFFEVLQAAFDAPPVPFSEDWPAQLDSLPSEETSYAGVRGLLIRQIVDLREMSAACTLDNEYRNLGVSAPRGAQWYNFEPASYLECGCDGSLGGWEPGDDMGREFVEGNVAVLNEHGKIEIRDPRELEPQRLELPELSWELVYDFFYCGQVYE